MTPVEVLALTQAALWVACFLQHLRITALERRGRR
jgi:hypothetical protein